MASTICMVGNGCSVLPSLWHLLCWKWKCGYDCIWMRRLEGDVPDPQRFIEIENSEHDKLPSLTLYIIHLSAFWHVLKVTLFISFYFFKDCKCAELRMDPRKLRVLALHRRLARACCRCWWMSCVKLGSWMNVRSSGGSEEIFMNICWFCSWNTFVIRVEPQ